MDDLSTSISVLAVSPNEGDIQLLSRILEHSAWKFQSVPGATEARKFLMQKPAQVVLSEYRFPDGSWQDVLDAACALPDPPRVLVLAGANDERTWAEVLKHGGWDILARPFRAREVFRTVHLAWRHWQDGSRARQRNLSIPRKAVSSDGRAISASARV